MQRFLERLLQITPAQAASFGDDPRQALARIRSWDEETCPSPAVWKRLQTPYVRGELERFKASWEFEDFGKTPAARRFVDEASVLEFYVTRERNPFYPFLAFGVSFDECVAWARAKNVCMFRDAAVYALMVREIRASGSFVTKERATKVLADEGHVDIDLSKLRPFGDAVLVGHPLEDVPFAEVTMNRAKETVKPAYRAFSAYREKMTLDDGLVLTSDGKGYRTRNALQELANRIKELNREVV